MAARPALDVAGTRDMGNFQATSTTTSTLPTCGTR